MLQIGRHRAFLREGEWRCAHDGLEGRLNRMMESWILETGGPSLDAADPEYEAARVMAAMIGGRLLRHIAAKKSDAAKVFFRKRQYKLAF